VTPASLGVEPPVNGARAGSISKEQEQTEEEEHDEDE
jgi:hypothetical protein